MLERRDEARRDTHVEAQGSRHLFGHDEGTCTLCAARTLLGDVPSDPAPLGAVTTRVRVDFADAAVVHPAGVAPDNQSRAPPILG